MKAFLVFALAASATAQLKFGSDSTEAPKKDVNTRLGLLGTSLGLSPTPRRVLPARSAPVLSVSLPPAYNVGRREGEGMIFRS